MHIDLTSEYVARIFPKIHAALVSTLKKKKQTASLPEKDWLWSYEYGVECGPNLPNVAHLTGKDFFEAYVDRLRITLKVTAGRVHALHHLESEEKEHLRTLPAEDIPSPWLNRVTRPKGPSVWCWRPDHLRSPGWREQVVLAGVRVPSTKTESASFLLLKVQDEAQNRFYVINEQTGEGSEHLTLKPAWTRALKKASDRDRDDVIQILKERSSSGYADLPVIAEVSLKEILGELSEEAGFITLALSSPRTKAEGKDVFQNARALPTPPSPSGPSSPQALRWAWGEGLPLTIHQRLACFDHAPDPHEGGGFSLLDAIARHNHAASTLNKGLDYGKTLTIQALAEGLSLKEALERTALTLKNAFGAPSPPEDGDPLEHVLTWMRTALKESTPSPPRPRHML